MYRMLVHVSQVNQIYALGDYMCVGEVDHAGDRVRVVV